MRARLLICLSSWLASWLLPGLLLSACYRKDPLYCDETTPCGGGQVCLMPQRECAPAGGDMPAPADLRAPDQGPPDLLTADMAAECTSPAQCTVAQRPVCSAGRCQPCRRNFECPGSACDEGGACHDKARILVVDDTLGACRTTGGPSATPYCYLADALADGDLGKGKDLILLRPSTRGGHRLDGSFLTIRTSVRIVGARGGRADPPVLVREPIDIRGLGTSVSLEDVAIGDLDSGGVNGIYCGLGASLSMSWGRIEGAPNNGIVSEGCKVRLVSDQILRNATNRTTYCSGINMQTGELTMYNTIVAENGEGNLQGGGVYLLAPGRVSIALSTITANKCVGVGQGCNLACALVNPAVSYSIVAGTTGGKQSMSGVCDVSNSVVPAGFSGGTGNLAGVSPVFASPAQADYHLSPTEPANKMLRKNEPSPALPFDLDDDPRPAGAVDIGADQIP